MLPILFALTIIVLLFIVVIAGQPGEFKLTRSTSIAAPPEKVFPHVNDFHKWEAWSPWAKLDPACKNTFEGAAAGTGAIFNWSGNKKVGEGRMTIVESLASNVTITPFATCAVRTRPGIMGLSRQSGQTGIERIRPLGVAIMKNDQGIRTFVVASLRLPFRLKWQSTVTPLMSWVPMTV